MLLKILTYATNIPYQSKVQNDQNKTEHEQVFRSFGDINIPRQMSCTV
jgi:hypothetical protein